MQVNQNIGNPLDVISSPLLDSQVSIERCEPSCACQIFRVFVSDMGPILKKILFGKAEIDQEQFGGLFASTDYKVVRLDISMNEGSVVYKLDPFDHLVADHKSGF